MEVLKKLGESQKDLISALSDLNGIATYVAPHTSYEKANDGQKVSIPICGSTKAYRVWQTWMSNRRWLLGSKAGLEFFVTAADVKDLSELCEMHVNVTYKAKGNRLHNRTRVD